MQACIGGAASRRSSDDHALVALTAGRHVASCLSSLAQHPRVLCATSATKLAELTRGPAWTRGAPDANPGIFRVRTVRTTTSWRVVGRDRPRPANTYSRTVRVQPSSQKPCSLLDVKRVDITADIPTRGGQASLTRRTRAHRGALVVTEVAATRVYCLETETHRLSG